MALAYLLDPQLQFSDKSGALSVAGFLRVYINGTDDLAVTYKDFNGTLNTADIVLDDNGRAVVIADSSKAYRLEVYNRLGGLMWTQYPINTIVGGAGGTNGIVVESTDGSIQVDKYNAGGLVHFDLSTEGAQELEWTRTDSYLIEESAEGVFLLPVNQAEGNMVVDGTGILLKANVHYDVSMFINIEAPSTAVNRFEGLQFRVGGPDAPVAAVTFDNSYAHRQVACLSCDVHPQADTRLRVYVEGLANGAVLSCSQCTVHSLAATYTTGGSTEYVAGEGIDIDHRVISVDPTVVQHTLIPGQNITIENNVISATGGGSGGTYTAGTGINIDSSNVISADFNTVQSKLVAGYGISLSGYIISSTVYMPPYAGADEGKCLVVDSNSFGGLSWQTRMKGDTIVLPAYTHSGDTVDGWSWSEFQARIDANVAAGTPTMLIRKSSGNHPEGETAFYYHAIRDTSIDPNNGWIYEFGTVVANPHTYQTMTVPTPSKSITYLFYQYGEDDVKVSIRYNQMVPCPYMEDNGYYWGSSLIIKEDGTGFEWSPRQDTPLIDVRYRNGELLDNINTIWTRALSYVNSGRTPILHADFTGASTSLPMDQYAGRTRLICNATNLYTQDGLDSAYGYMRFAGLDYWSGGIEYPLATYRIVGHLEKSSANSTPTITWYKSATVDNCSPWTP